MWFSSLVYFRRDRMKKVIITGNIGNTPIARISKEGKEFVTFSLGVSVGNKNNPKTDWVDIICNDKLAILASSYFDKGTKLLIEGYPTVNAYIDKNNQAIGTLKIFANNIEILSSKSEVTKSNNDSYLESDDIPF